MIVYLDTIILLRSDSFTIITNDLSPGFFSCNLIVSDNFNNPNALRVELSVEDASAFTINPDAFEKTIEKG